MPKARGLPRSGAIPAPGQTGTGEGTAAHGDTTPLLRWTHSTMGESKPRPRLRRLVGAQWIVERKPATCRLRSDLPGSRSPAVEGALIESGTHCVDHNPRPAFRAESSSRIN